MTNYVFCLPELSSEQLVLLDMMVLAKSTKVVGFDSSLFSFFTREFRALNNFARTTSTFVNMTSDGIDPLFESAGTLVT